MRSSTGRAWSNAINLEVHKGLREALHRAGEDDNVHVLVLSGKGRAFSSWAATCAPVPRIGPRSTP